MFSVLRLTSMYSFLYKELEEIDLQFIINRHPRIVSVDELAHTNPEGSKNCKRWQDVFGILHAGISVISAVNF